MGIFAIAFLLLSLGLCFLAFNHLTDFNMPVWLCVVLATGPLVLTYFLGIFGFMVAAFAVGAMYKAGS